MDNKVIDHKIILKRYISEIDYEIINKLKINGMVHPIWRRRESLQSFVLWLLRKVKEESKAFITGFGIVPDFRANGYGRQALYTMFKHVE
ncbi:hypothetical protein [Clostridium isatidis]|uniref:Uncharacterized protein n=1 Tax=Clostridium isatidis TaxID=182773 RepID=A0A343JF34_9CLOT|nr:hypothetical protein [Clostridium isatidis]ASW44142.1 hypothetical protein BEN51_11940 [Clostridium isatidis]